MLGLANPEEWFWFSPFRVGARGLRLIPLVWL